jgi:hypothetical protein
LQQIKKKAEAESKNCHAKTKHEGGINGRDDKPSGIDIRMADALTKKFNPTDPLILA